jgi:hypothetical protein
MHTKPYRTSAEDEELNRLKKRRKFWQSVGLIASLLGVVGIILIMSARPEWKDSWVLAALIPWLLVSLFAAWRHGRATTRHDRLVGYTFEFDQNSQQAWIDEAAKLKRQQRGRLWKFLVSVVIWVAILALLAFVLKASETWIAVFSGTYTLLLYAYFSKLLLTWRKRGALVEQMRRRYPQVINKK